ncbi:hypothetical protein LTR99_000100 [Exophiala xenobiotica]|uniref:Uncharacterized protein n=1 Tax=Vermiconidia calcicola TaxID=1690605 RepID=A0AAV9PV35_9PEZI|nr:hypothetical protein LTR92_009170 [Exophiala xenobiotica]KAK5530090.1 hypothetical protein LTR25_009336 [Vermiconidia calcicola]KAK5547410.1 hypothetical protein LTR23_002632 [Chaetothyriales sp. CCFEE 6169]KAK5265377.1 hypothetical protein LTR96_009279 [Exophiala xenobiotica]KAK5307132.1 hypothetical protein LTR99_000100 [Exophiala xenobiotica]
MAPPAGDFTIKRYSSGGNHMSRVFEVPISHGASARISISEPELRALGLSLTTWTSSFVLAGQLHKLDVHPAKSSTLPVLELGAGTGLVGLTAAMLWRVPVVLTDLSPIVPGLAGNIKLNSSVVKDLVQCGSLDWTAPDLLELQSGKTYTAQKDKASVILAADVIYCEEHPELLAKTIFRWLADGPASRVVIAWPLRVAYLDHLREMWELLETGGLEAIEEGREQASTEDWDDECLIEFSVWRWKSSNGARASS